MQSFEMWKNELKRQKNRNYIYEKIKTGLISGNVCYSVFQKRLSSHPMYRALELKLKKTAFYSETV
jgi:hypothetical protein